LEIAGAHNNPTHISYVITSPEIAAGFLFANRLRAGVPENPFNKILWVTRTENRGLLTITGHPTDSGSIEGISLVEPAGPGYIYPSTMNVPSSGCWHFTLSWDGNNAEIDLLFQ